MQTWQLGRSKGSGGTQTFNINFTMRSILPAVIALLGSAAHAAVLFSNGPHITGPAGSGITAPDPISSPEAFTTSGGLITTTAGISVKAFRAADDFTLSDWTYLTNVTLYAFQTQSSAQAGSKVPTVVSAQLNLWTAVPGTAGASPVLTTPITVAPTASPFSAWRQSTVPGTTNGTRPIFAYTFPLSSLPDSGLLAPGTYWLEWQLSNTPQTANLFSPLVTPRAQAFNRNFRLFGVPFSGAQPQWFESWEGGDPNSPRPFAVPMHISGTIVPEPTAPACLLPAAMLILRRRKRTL
jgi:hypothetical protein